MSTNEDAVATIIGLTGGIATGKSTVSQILRELGARVIDADQVAREVVEPGTPGLAEIVETFGDTVLNDDGTLDRAALGEVIFADPAARSRLNAITHPRIGMRMMEHAAEATEQGFAWVIYDAALLVENGIHRAFAGLIVVTCSEETQLNRLMARDGLDRDAAEARIDSQMPLAEKAAVADWVVENDGTLDATHARVEDVFSELCARFGPPRDEPQSTDSRD